MSLSQLITDSQRNTVTDDHGQWRQFILDHLNYISVRAPRYYIRATEMNNYRYDLKRFLKEYLKRHEDMAWIVVLLNSLKNDFDFHVAKEYIIPTDSMVTDLYKSYITVSSSGR